MSLQFYLDGFKPGHPALSSPQLGHADGVACRTIEMFEAFGFSELVLRKACCLNETSFWKPGD